MKTNLKLGDVYENGYGNLSGITLFRPGSGVYLLQWDDDHFDDEYNFPLWNIPFIRPFYRF